MLRSKIFRVLILFLFVLVVAMIDGAVAAEKVKYHGTGVTTKWQQMEVGDEEGHVLALSESKNIWINEITGEKTAGISRNTMDINLKTGQGTLRGYGLGTDPDGDKIFRMHEGKPVGKGHWKGTWSYFKGTGKYEGIKGGGTWDTYSLAPQMSSIEVEGEVDIPK